MTKIFSVLSLLLVSSFSIAELKELDDEALSAVQGKGIVIDMEYELYIGEIAFKFADNQDANTAAGNNTASRIQDRK